MSQTDEVIFALLATGYVERGLESRFAVYRRHTEAVMITDEEAMHVVGLEMLEDGRCHLWGLLGAYEDTEDIIAAIP